MVQEKFLVLVQERLALGAVDDDGLCLRAQLDVSWKAGPAGADNARFPGWDPSFRFLSRTNRNQ